MQKIEYNIGLYLTLGFSVSLGRVSEIFPSQVISKYSALTPKVILHIVANQMQTMFGSFAPRFPTMRIFPTTQRSLLYIDFHFLLFFQSSVEN